MQIRGIINKLQGAEQCRNLLRVMTPILTVLYISIHVYSVCPEPLYAHKRHSFLLPPIQSPITIQICVHQRIT